MSTQEANPAPIATSKPRGQLILPAGDRHTAALSGLIDSVLHKLSSYQSDQGLGCLSIGVVSSGKRVGVSTVTHRLAMQAALGGEGRVLIVDANSLRPSQHKLSGVAEGPGLTEHLAGTVELDKCIQESHVRDLDVLPWGSGKITGLNVPPGQLKELFADLRIRYRFILIDLPSMDDEIGAVALPYAMMTDGVVVVLDGAASKQNPTKEMVDVLQEHGIKVLGAIMNRYSHTLPRWLRRWF